MRSLSQKLLLKAGQRLLLFNAPDGYRAALGELPENVQIESTPDGTYDAVQVFVYNKADVERLAADAVRWVKKGGLLWFTYPKLTGTIKTDLTRDVGWERVEQLGWRFVTQIAVDDTWSAVRVRPAEDVGK